MRVTKSSAVWVGAGAITSAGAGFLFNFVLARGLGPAGTGVVLSFATWFTMLMTLGKLGTDTAVMRESARSVAGVTTVSAGQYAKWAVRIIGPVGVAAGILLWIFTPQAHHVLASIPGANTDSIVRLGAVMLPFAIVGLVLLSSLRGLGEMFPFVGVEQILKPVLRFTAAAALLMVASTSVFWYSAAWVVPTLIGFVITMFLVRRSRREFKFAHSDDVVVQKAARHGMWTFARPRAVAQGADILNTSVGVVVLGIASTATETGLFGTAMRIVLVGYLAFNALRLLIAPNIAHGLALNDIPAVQRIYTGSNSLVVAVAWPLYLFMLGGSVLVLRMFGTGFEASAGILTVLVAVAMAIAVLGNMQTVVLMSGHSRAALLGTTAALVTNVAVTLCLVTFIGGMAAAIGWGLGMIAEAAILRTVMVRLGLHPAAPQTLKLAGRTLISLAPAAFVLYYFSHSLWALGVIIYVAAVLGWAAWCRTLIRGAWRELTHRGHQEAGEAQGERDRTIEREVERA